MRSRENAHLRGEVNRFASRVDFELAVNLFDVGGDSVRGDAQHFTDVSKAHASAEQMEDFCLSGRERILN